MASYLDPDKKPFATRGDLPHFSLDDTLCFVTFRLSDSLPADIVQVFADEFTTFAKEHTDWEPEKLRREYAIQRHRRLDQYLDRGYGACPLRDPALRLLVVRALHYFEGQRYRLHCFVVMPNHVHVLLAPLPGYTVQQIMHSIKRYTAREINLALGLQGRFWQREYFDRLIRSQRHYDYVLAYIHRNPFQLPAGTYTLWEADPSAWLQWDIRWGGH